MKQYFSIFALSARSTLFKLIGIIALMGMAEITMFYMAIKENSYGMLLEDLMDDSLVVIPFAIGFILYYITLAQNFNGKHATKAAMTTARLGIKESGVCWTMAVYNMSMLIVFLAAQLAIVLILCKMYLDSHLAGDYQHTVFIAFYRNGMMHGLLPLEDYWTYIENAFYIIGLGICASYASKKDRHGKHEGITGLAAGMVALAFCNRANYYSGLDFSIGLIPITIYAAICISKGGSLDEDEEETASPNLA